MEVGTTLAGGSRNNPDIPWDKRANELSDTSWNLLERRAATGVV